MRIALKIIIFLSLPFLLFPQESFIKELCEKREKMSEVLKSYKVVANVENFVYDGKGNLIRTDKRDIELYWDGNKWTEKGGKEILGMTRKTVNPFKCNDVSFFQYEVKDWGQEWCIQVKLLEKYQGLEAEEGNYIVSKNSSYFKKTFTTLTKCPSDLKNFQLETEYGEIGKGVIAPMKMKIETDIDEEAYGVSIKTISILNFTYKKN